MISFVGVFIFGYVIYDLYEKRLERDKVVQRLVWKYSSHTRYAKYYGEIYGR